MLRENRDVLYKPNHRKSLALVWLPEEVETRKCFAALLQWLLGAAPCGCAMCNRCYHSRYLEEAEICCAVFQDGALCAVAPRRGCRSCATAGRYAATQADRPESPSRPRPSAATVADERQCSGQCCNMLQCCSVMSYCFSNMASVATCCSVLQHPVLFPRPTPFSCDVDPTRVR